MLDLVEGVVWVDSLTIVGLDETTVRETVWSEEDMMKLGKVGEEVVKGERGPNG